MPSLSPVGLMILGFPMLLVSFLVIFAIVLRMIEAGFLLSFGTYAVSFLGLMVGLAGVVGYGQRRP